MGLFDKLRGKASGGNNTGEIKQEQEHAVSNQQKCTDESGMFEDLNFKLVVIDALLNKSPSFKAELEALKEQFVDNYEWYSGSGPISQIMEFFIQLKLEKIDLEKVEELCFDGGNEVYQFIQPDWDGEDSLFDIQSVKGFEHLPNLKSVCYISMCYETVLNPLKEKGIEIT